MQTLVFMAVCIAVMLVNFLFSFVLGWFLTEAVKLPWDKKPFNCRGCLSFWLTFLLGTLWAFALVFRIAPDILNAAGRAIVIVGLSGVAFLSGIISYLYINSKIKINE